MEFYVKVVVTASIIFFISIFIESAIQEYFDGKYYSIRKDI